MDTVASPSFATLLRRYRLAAGLTQEGLAERAHMSVRGVSDLERGLRTAPRTDTVQLLALALGLTDEDERMLRSSVSRRRTAGRHGRPVLPAEPTPLLGRTLEEARALELLRGGVRLLTLTGPGGVGKTRLALRLARRLEADLSGAATFISLASIRDSALVPATITTTLGIQPRRGRPIDELLIEHLSRAPSLLVLDNFEHVLDAAPFVSHVLSSCPVLTVIASSRAPLRLQAEHEMEIRPLAVPPSTPAPGDALRYASVALFLERARSARLDFQGTEENLPVIAEICRRLDGLPLAIELAAVHVKVLPPEDLLSRLERRLPLLRGGPRDLPARQQTMRDAIAWSYNLLDSYEQEVFRRLAVFAGGCTIDAAEAVLQGVPSPPIGAVESLTALVDKSLLMVRDDPTGTRFGMLETVREFAEEQLRAAGEAQQARRDHAAFFLDLVTEPELANVGPSQVLWLDRLESDHANLRAALTYALDMGDLTLGLDLAGRLWPFWRERNHYDEAHYWFSAFLLRADPDQGHPLIRSRALTAMGKLASLRVESELPFSLFEEALALAREAGEWRQIAATLHSLGEVESAQSNYPAHEALLEEALSIYRRLDDPSGMCSVLGSLGTILRYQGEFQRAADLYEEAIRLGRAVGDHVRVADLLARWGTLETERGKPTLSFARFDEANAMYYKLGNAHGEADIQLRTGETLASMGRYAEAMALYETCIEIFRTLGSTYAVAYTEIFQAEAALGINDPARASALAGQARDFFHTIGDRRSAGEALFHLAAAAAADRRGEASGLYQESLAIHHAIKTRPQVARCLERLAILAAEGGEMGRAARLHGGARTLRLEMGAAMMPADYDRYNRALERVRELMGDEEFTAAVAQGEQMTCDEVVALALNGHSAVRV